MSSDISVQFILSQPPLWQVLREGCFNEQDVTPDLKAFETLLTELKVAHHRTEFHCYNNQDHYHGVLLLMAWWRLYLLFLREAFNLPVLATKSTAYF